MISGVGVDVCRVDRIAEIWTRFGDRFLRRILTPVERGQKKWTAEKLARRYAMKEAVAKACRTGIGGKVGFQGIEVTYDEAHAPVVRVRGVEGRVSASTSDDPPYAVAFAVWEKA